MRIKYLHLNLWLGGKLWEPMVDFVRQTNADILATQEVFNSHDSSLAPNFRTMDEFSSIFQYKYSYFDRCFIKNYFGTVMETGNAIFSKYPISSRDSLLLDGIFGEYQENPEDFRIQPRRIQHAAIDISGIELNVFNTQGIWGKDGSDSPRRIKMAQSILDFIGDKENVVLSGDFNVNEGTNTIGMLGEKFIDVFKDERKTSFNMKQKTDPGYASAIVDFVFVSPGLKVFKHECPDVDVSDHLPLVVKIEV